MKYNKVPLFYLLLISATQFGCNKSTINEITPIDPVTQVPADSAKLLFIGAKSYSNPGTSHSLTAYDASKNKKWEFLGTTYAEGKSVNTYLGGALFITTNEDVLESINPSTGVLNWGNSNFKSMLTYGFLLSDQLLTDTIVAATSTLAPSSKNTLSLINKSTGNIFWSKIITDQPIIPPAFSNGKIYCVTTNSTGTNMLLSSYDIVTQNLVWQKSISNSFLMSLPAPMIIRGDTIIVGSTTKSLNVINKINGNTIWSKSFNTDKAYLYGSNIIYNDLTFSNVVTVSLQTGDVIRQSEVIPYSRFSGLSYIYDNCFYNKVNDSVFCTNLADGTVKWRKLTATNNNYTTLQCIGNTVYGSRQFISIVTPESAKLMILNAKDFSFKDSIAVPLASFNFFTLSTGDKFYK